MGLGRGGCGVRGWGSGGAASWSRRRCLCPFWPVEVCRGLGFGLRGGVDGHALVTSGLASIEASAMRSAVWAMRCMVIGWRRLCACVGVDPDASSDRVERSIESQSGHPNHLCGLNAGHALEGAWGLSGLHHHRRLRGVVPSLTYRPQRPNGPQPPHHTYITGPRSSPSQHVGRRRQQRQPAVGRGGRDGGGDAAAAQQGDAGTYVATTCGCMCMSGCGEGVGCVCD